MTATIGRIRDLVSDLKSNWYVRVWVLIWMVLALVAFICLIELGHQSQESQNRPEIATWYTNESSLNLPDFHFHTDGVDVISSISCSFFGQPVPGGDCTPWPGPFQPTPYNCRAVFASQITVFSKNSPDPLNLGVDCNITVVGNDTSFGQILGWGFDGWGSFISGPVGHTAFWLHPTQGAVINLIKGEIDISKKIIIDDWNANLMYMSSNSTSGFFRVRTNVRGFGVFHNALVNVFNGWKAVGDIGGFAFFMVFLHTIVMIIVGVMLSKHESAFLNSHNNAGHAPVASEGYTNIAGG